MCVCVCVRVNSEAEREYMHVGQGQDKAVVHVLYYTIKVHYTQKFNIALHIL